MTHEELEDAVPLYAVGGLERAERQAVEAHLLSGCVSCHGALKEYQSVAVILPFSLHIVPPPRTLKAKIMAARIPSANQDAAAQEAGKPNLEPGEWMNHLFPPEAHSHTASFGWAIGIAMAAIVAGGGYAAWTAYDTRVSEDTTKLTRLQDQAASVGSKLSALRQQLEERDTSLAQAREELEHQRTELADLKDQLIQREAELDVAKAQLDQPGRRQGQAPQDELAALLRAPRVNAVSMSGTEMTKRASGLLLYDPRTHKAWLYALNLPESPSGMTYQLWAMDEKPASIGTFRVGRGETSHLLVGAAPRFMTARNFSVTLEPLGGRPQPMGPLYLTAQP
jgi:hypothetical protein